MKDLYPAPLVSDLTQATQKVQATSKYFAVIDLASRHFAHRHVADMLANLSQQERPFVFSCVEDILIWGETKEQVQKLTETVLALIQEAGFKVNVEKAQGVQPPVTCLGIVARKEGRPVDRRRVKGLLNMSAPSPVRSLRGRLGGFNFLRPHIYTYAEITLPLWKLLQTKTQWEWGPEQESALETLKRKAVTAPALGLHGESKPFLIRLAANKIVFAATLLQNNEEGKLVPGASASKKLQGAELNFDPCEVNV